MREWDDHYVARSVRKAVQDDETVLGAMDDPCFGVRKLGQFAENATIVRFRFAGVGDVGIAPGRPEVVHKNRAIG